MWPNRQNSASKKHRDVDGNCRMVALCHCNRRPRYLICYSSRSENICNTVLCMSGISICSPQCQNKISSEVRVSLRVYKSSKSSCARVGKKKSAARGQSFCFTSFLFRKVILCNIAEKFARSIANQRHDREEEHWIRCQYQFHCHQPDLRQDCCENSHGDTNDHLPRHLRQRSEPAAPCQRHEHKEYTDKCQINVYRIGSDAERFDQPHARGSQQR